MGKKWRYGVILDAGSSGTRLHVYRWKDPAKALHDASPEELQSLPKLHTDKDWTKKIRPGVSTFGDRPDEVGPDHLEELVKHALKVVPKDKVKDTPIFLMATAGVRLLPQLQQKALLTEVCSYLKHNTDFALPDCDLHIQVIKGETEGLYGWIASNYLLGGFDRPELHRHGKGHHTYGFLDMGGASAQIAFAPNSTEAEKHWDDLKLLRMRTLDGRASEYKVFTATWLGFGVNQARKDYIAKLQEEYDTRDNNEIPDSCMPKGLRTTLDGTYVKGSAGSNLTLLGTGDFAKCMLDTKPLLKQDAPCKNEPCLLDGQHVPAIDFDVNHFIGVSEYWHTTHGVFGKGDKAYDFTTYQQTVKDFCGQSWKQIASGLDSGKKKADKKAEEAQQACFKASWLLNVLHEGIGVPRIGLEQQPGFNVSKGALESAKEKGFLDPFQAVDKIDGIEVSWTLGKMVLYAAGQVPPKGKDLPVGFGTNAVDNTVTPSDFNFAGSRWEPIKDDHHEDDDGVIDDLMDHAKKKSTSGFLLFILILILLAYIFRKKERRLRLYSRIFSFTRRSRRPGSPRFKSNRGGLAGFTSKLFGRRSRDYERVMEEGEADQFELGDVDSDDNEHSDSSEGSRLGRSSGLATPKVNLVDDLRVGSALDRSGLVVRTESRERLAPTLLGAGRRSRAGSPTRLKSPLMAPLQED